MANATVDKMMATQSSFILLPASITRVFENKCCHSGGGLSRRRHASSELERETEDVPVLLCEESFLPPSASAYDDGRRVIGIIDNRIIAFLSDEVLEEFEKPFTMPLPPVLLSQPELMKLDHVVRLSTAKLPQNVPVFWVSRVSCAMFVSACFMPDGMTDHSIIISPDK
jgi:hypothetical protein